MSLSDTKDLNGCHRHARDQWLRAAQLIPLNIAEGNGKRSLKDRSRFLDIAPADVVAETQAEYNTGVEYEYRDAEYEYKYDRDKPAPSREPKQATRRF